jgi:phosphatidate cytidylyltransferase
MERREQLRLRTSLLVMDADEPWAAGGWSRPGSTLGAVPSARVAPTPNVAPMPTLPPFNPIDTGSPPVVPESDSRRRWSWSRKRDTPTSPSTPQDTLRHVIIVKERSVSGREDETGSEEQDELPFDDLTSPTQETNGDLEELTAWSDMDWEFETDVATPSEPSPASVESPNAETSGDDSPDVSPDDWESFTAEDYVQTATHEYADLAAAVAAADTEEPEQAALSADMPGLESGLVSLDDVVAAEGMERAAAAPDRSDLAIRVLTALGLITLFFASLTYRWSIGLLVLVVMTVAAGELATSLTRRGYHPVGLFSYLGTIGALAGTWIYGPVAIPVAVAVTILVVVVFFGLVTGRQDPLVGMALTVITVMWVGVFGSFAYDLVEAAEYRWLIGALVVIVAGMDVVSYFVGKRLGKRLLAPVVSPKKTVAGLVGGVVAAVGIGYGVSFVAPFDWETGLVLGGALAVTGPLGDLAVSVLKRAMQVKDMGTILPGHGGVVDRIDAILFSLPAAWAVYAWAGLLV